MLSTNLDRRTALKLMGAGAISLAAADPVWLLPIHVATVFSLHRSWARCRTCIHGTTATMTLAWFRS